MHIALVDPSRAVRAAITQPLILRGHQVEGFSDPHQALQTVKTDLSIDAVITSTELAPISGIELCWEARLIAGGQRPIYILLMSSHDDHDTMIEALDSGADDFIKKPPHPEELYAKLRAGERLITLQRELVRLATTDPLTGLYNRRAFFERGAAICETAKSGQASVILFDIDHFKQVNDRYGHKTGDLAIQSIAEIVARDHEIAARLGGDEFCLLLQDRSLAQAVEIATKLCRRFVALKIETDQGPIKVSCSLGVAELAVGDSLDDIINRADLALYRAKREGRNRVATPPDQAWVERNARETKPVARIGAR